MAITAEVDLIKTPQQQTPKNKPAAAKSTTADKSSADDALTLTETMRAELTRVKQNVAFAENLQLEAKHDPQDIYKALDNALAITGKLLSSGSLDLGLKNKLTEIHSGIQTIKANINDAAAYKKVRALLEPLTDNPGE